MNKIRKILIIIITATCISSIYSQEKEFSLKAAQEYAIKNNYSLKNYDLDIEMAKQKVNEIITIGLPQVNGEASYQRFVDGPKMLLPSDAFSSIGSSLAPLYIALAKLGEPLPLPETPKEKYIVMNATPRNSVNYKASVSQLLFDGSYLIGLQAAKVYVDISKANKTKNEVDVKYAVAQTYYMILVIEENIKLLDSSIENLSKINYEMREMQKVGFLDETEADQIELQYKTLINNRKKIASQLDAAYNLLKFQMGITIDEKIKLVDNVNTLLLSNTIDNVEDLKSDITKHPDIQLLSVMQKAKDLSLKKERIAYFPSLVGFYSYSMDFKSDNMNIFSKDEKWLPTGVVGISLKIPILDCGNKYYKIQQAKLDIEKLNNQKYMAEEAIKMDIDNSKKSYLSAIDMYKKEQKNLELSKKIYDRTVIKFNNGLVSSMDLTQANNQYLSAQTNYFNSILEVLNAKLKLDKALGQL